eukprot:15448286-Alexandrium_andersonii.AAC.1
MPNGPNVPSLQGSGLANVGDTSRASASGARGAAIRAAPPALGSASWGSPTCHRFRASERD